MASKDYRSLRNKHDRFTWSQPVGYSFKEVDAAIDEYSNEIAKALDTIQRRDDLIESLKKEIERLETGMVDLNIQMRSYDTPMYGDEETLEILNDFASRDYSDVENNDPHVDVPIISDVPHEDDFMEDVEVEFPDYPDDMSHREMPEYRRPPVRKKKRKKKATPAKPNNSGRRKRQDGDEHFDLGSIIN